MKKIAAVILCFILFAGCAGSPGRSDSGETQTEVHGGQQVIVNLTDTILGGFLGVFAGGLTRVFIGIGNSQSLQTANSYGSTGAVIGGILGAGLGYLLSPKAEQKKE
ncbi:MAG TPA: hypothetical protein PLB12_11915 [Candidatus Goldiibacteriota bacterium]|nr:hypothetical protein [Candidatus Goldiibacteriota bacterium]HRQ45043.1 hypothetical protein [Candidatus Goldiibacteriota bacterium]